MIMAYCIVVLLLVYIAIELWLGRRRPSRAEPQRNETSVLVIGRHAEIDAASRCRGENVRCRLKQT